MAVSHYIARPVETVYDGCRFRSRLEARWAVFFNTLGIPYEYEKETYDLGGLWYLPDFWLPWWNSWFEVKGDVSNDDARLLANEKLSKLVQATGHPGFMAVGDIKSKPKELYAYTPHSRGYAYWDCSYYFVECFSCKGLNLGKVDEEGYPEDSHYLHCAKKKNLLTFPLTDQAITRFKYPNQSSRLLLAYKAARSARFEYGR